MNMDRYYIFDVDGTICYPRKKMENDFCEYFYAFCCKNQVALVSGSSVEMIKEQIPDFIIDKVKLYGCSGVEGSSFKIEDISDSELIETLESFINTTSFNPLCGNHISFRRGMINFSICGRNADFSTRNSFELYDKKFSEREFFIKALRKKFQHKYEIHLGGSTSIDISRIGVNKSLVAKDIMSLNSPTKLIFFGDGILNFGNDYPLAKYIYENKLGYSTQIEYPELKYNYERILI